VDLYEPALAGLAQRFRFLPAARYDDIMVSYATDNGGVGPHIDQYDVFLLQAHGRRRWRIARQADPALIDGLPLRILANFQPEEEWELAAGDLLYLPPGVAHEGVALGDSITISVGYRLPRLQELADTWSDIQARDCPAEDRLGDPGRTPVSHAGELPPDLVKAAWRGLKRLQPGPRDAQRALLENLTEPKSIVVFDEPDPLLSPARFAKEAQRQGLHLDLRSRLLYAGKGVERDIALNGECRSWQELRASIPGGLQTAAWKRLQRLADTRTLSGADLGSDLAALPLWYDWYEAGWLCPGQLPVNAG
jgi:50S ribosomal protein L16 3-hydroxylase